MTIYTDYINSVIFAVRVYNCGVDFLQDKDGEASTLLDALPSGRYSLFSEKVIGFECTFSVENLDSTLEKVKQNRGTMLMPKVEIPYVGWISKFIDSESILFVPCKTVR